MANFRLFAALLAGCLALGVELARGETADAPHALTDVAPPTAVPEVPLYEAPGWAAATAPPPIPASTPPSGRLGLFRSSEHWPRHIGKGDPLTGSSWLNRPHSLGVFVGPIFNDTLVTDQIDQDSSVLAGLRLGWDFDHYWGSELRFGWSTADLSGPPDDPNSDIFLSDVDLLYYPWGDSRFRPYLLLGLGMATFDYVDLQGMERDAVLLGMPFGGGLKYQAHPRLAFRLEVLDNLAFENDRLDTMHNVSLSFGLELRYGGTRRVYFPWQPSRHVR